MNEGFQPCWALIELFGHDRIAGKVSEAEIAGVRFLRVEVPGLDDGLVSEEGYTRYFGGAAIFSVTPLGEDLCRSIAKELGMPNLPLDIQHITNRLLSNGRPVSVY